MDGILVPLLSLIVGGALGLTCAVRPRLRAYSLAALVTTPATSVTFLLGAFLLADMNPARAGLLIFRPVENTILRDSKTFFGLQR